jgi:tetratricopeptide (TPR) repeat protein
VVVSQPCLKQGETVRFSVLLVRAAIFLLFASPVAVSRAVAGDVDNQPAPDDTDTCVHGTADEQIAACTALIQSGRWSGTGLASIFGNRCFAYNNKGEFDRAIADCNQVLTLDPKNAHAFNSRGNSYVYKHEYDRAIEDFDEAIRLDSRYVQAFNNRGNAYKYKGQYDRAIQDYDEAIKLDPKFAIAFNSRGSAFYEKGQYGRAIEDFDEAIRLDPKNPVPIRNRELTIRKKNREL